jgi:SagB-type dehydrogenase family enzyme
LVFLARNPDLLLCWSGNGLLVRDLNRGVSFAVSTDLLVILDLFDRPLAAETVPRRLPRYERTSVLRGVRQLQRMGLLLPADQARQRASRLAVWKGNLAAALYHVSSRDKPYLQNESAIDLFLNEHVISKPRPRRYKHYPGVPRIRFPKSGEPRSDAAALQRVLEARRTVREFSREPVAFRDLAAVVRGTWGETGWLDGGALGRLTAKSSPSAGGLHPIECYMLAWNVRGLPPGLYHYDVKEDQLRRLKGGDFRNAAVRAASGQRWVGRASFLCIMTAVFTRTLWKYAFEVAYRVLWLDAGHLCQTFDLLATSRGLGPFQTAAIQDSFIEKLIGLDGVKEFPLYLCGAGIPQPRFSETVIGSGLRRPAKRDRSLGF